MESHELAKKLLELPNKRISVVVGSDGQYTREMSVAPGSPWVGPGDIRIQLEESIAVQAGSA